MAKGQVEKRRLIIKDVSVTIDDTVYTRKNGAWTANTIWHNAADMLDHIATLACERDGARRDAARLDWLESEKTFRAGFYPTLGRPHWRLEATGVTMGASLREAIDEAMPVAALTAAQSAPADE